LTTFPAFHKLPYTVVLFALGLLATLAHKAMESSMENLELVDRTYEMWMDIDSHLLIFTMLPVLLTGDAMSIDTSVAKRVFSQCIWLAGPGVCVGAFGTAIFLNLYLGWDFLVCLTCGSILCATDPVAVVGLLKELGASPTLTVQIQGESLLNDGTAMVLFNVAYNMLKGEDHDAKSITIYMIYMVGCSWFLGMVIGAFFSSWIKAAGNRLEHHSNMIQISLTLCCAYGSFVLAEGVLGVSGVLSTVAAALMLADNIWVSVVNVSAMHEVWHTFEYIGNTLIFFLAGCLSGKSLWLIKGEDVLHLLVIYVVLVVIRAIIMFASRPVLRLLSADRTPVSAADAAVMTWGGLRGAVGLALSITVMRDRAENNIDEDEANLVFFFTAGIAFLTLMINATTCPTLVNSLGIAKCPESKNKVLMDIVRRLEEKREESGREEQCAVAEVLDYVVHHIDFEDSEHHGEHSDKPRTSKLRGATDGMPDKADGHSAHAAEKTEDNSDRRGSNGSNGMIWLNNEIYLKSGADLVADYKMIKQTFLTVPDVNKELLGWDGNWPTEFQEQNLFRLVQGPNPDAGMVRTITESFLALVRGDFWAQIHRGEFVEGTHSIEALLTTNSKAMHMSARGVTDYDCLSEYLGIHERSKVKAREGAAVEVEDLNVTLDFDESDTSLRNKMRKVVEHGIFNACILLVICVNAIFIFLDPGPDSDDAVTFLIIDSCFLTIYIFEMAAKLYVMHKAYFTNGWNALDFVCVILGIFGVGTTILVQLDVVSASAISSEMLLIRLGRVFKMIRVMRIVVILKFLRKLQAKWRGEPISPELAIHLELIFTLRGFIQAHLQSQQKFLKYFGAQKQRCQCGNKLLMDSAFCRKCGTKRPADMPIEGFYSITGCEQARTILESWTAIFHATIVASLECTKADAFGHWILEGLESLRETAEVTEKLADFVMQAADDGVILPKDAERIIHPMHEHLKLTSVIVRDTHSGIHRKVLERQSTGDRETAIRESSSHGDPLSPRSPGLKPGTWDDPPSDNGSDNGEKATDPAKDDNNKVIDCTVVDLDIEEDVSAKMPKSKPTKSATNVSDIDAFNPRVADEGLAGA
jgi:sodium/hydrogen exchanger 10/11